MANGAFNFAQSNPDTYADWAKYAGFDRTTGTIHNAVAPQSTAQQNAGIQPPQSIKDLYSQKIGQIGQKFTNIGNAADQLSQGNLMNAASAMNTPYSPQPANPAETSSSGDGGTGIIGNIVKFATDW